MTRLLSTLPGNSRAAKLLAAGLIFFAASSCISVDVGIKPPAPSKGVVYRSPGPPFQPLAQTRADRAWKSRSSGNSISFHSSCHDPADPALETVLREMLNELQDLRTLRTQTVTFNAREAIDSEVEGRLDGIPTRIRSIVFKKNNCLYTISHIGLPASFEGDRERFDEFLAGFRAP
jgi:hypothetical protein